MSGKYRILYSNLGHLTRKFIPTGLQRHPYCRIYVPWQFAEIRILLAFATWYKVSFSSRLNSRIKNILLPPPPDFGTAPTAHENPHQQRWRHSLCPAVLTENFFQDSLSDVRYLRSEAGKQAIVDTHVEGITDFLKSIPSDRNLRNSPTI